LVLIRTSAVDTDELLRAVDDKLNQYQGKRCLLVSISIDRVARTKSTVEQLCGILRPHDAVMSLLWPSDPGHDRSTEMTLLWGVVQGMIRSHNPRAVLAPTIWANASGIVPAYRSIVLSMLGESESYLNVRAKNGRRAPPALRSDLSHLFVNGSRESVEKWILSKTDLEPGDFTVTTRAGQGAVLSPQDSIPGGPKCGCSDGNCDCPRLCTCECPFCHRWCLGKEPDGSPCQRVPPPGRAYYAQCRKKKSSLQVCQTPEYGRPSNGHTYYDQCRAKKSSLQVCQTPECGRPSNGQAYCAQCRKKKSSLQVCQTPECGRPSNGHTYCDQCRKKKSSLQVCQTPECGRPSHGHTHCAQCQKKKSNLQTCQTPECGRPSHGEAFCRRYRGEKNKTLDCKVEGCAQKRCNMNAVFCRPHLKEYDGWKRARGSSGGPRVVEDFVSYKAPGSGGQDGR
jgi:hypothetical protein